jgi:hypothetical protein
MRPKIDPQTGNVNLVNDLDQVAGNVTVISPSNGDVLTFSNGEWVNQAGSGDLMATYNTMDVDDSASPITYVGKQDKDENWMIMKIDETTGVVISYASVLNNPTVTSYDDAWVVKDTTLVYGEYASAF